MKFYTALADDELLDVVDTNDTVTGTILRSQWKTLNDAYIRTVLAFIVDQQGRLAFFRRSPEKSHPRAWALVGGCVQSGELYEAAFAREVLEEVNIDVSRHAVRYLGKVTPQEFQSAFFKGVYEITVNTEKIDFAADAFCQLVWLAPHEVSAESLDLHMPDLFYLVNRFYGAK